MNWLYLSLAILSEVVGTMLIRVSNGFTKFVPTVALILFYVLSYFFFNQTLKRMDLSTAYAVWSGVGTALLAGLGFIFFKEQVSIERIIAIGLIIAGVCILNITGGKADNKISQQSKSQGIDKETR